LELGTRFGKNFTNIRKRLAEPPRTIVHDDYRLDNLFFSSPEGGGSFAVIDWQLAQRGRGVSDVAYFLGFCLPVEQRRTMEMSLLKIYHSVLVENGVREYEFDQCLHDFRLSTLQVLFRVVTAGGLLDFTSERGRALVETLLQRSFTIMDDHNVGELMSE
jgi:aminoglycoside/choline kinase family phosphotransferase